MKTNLKKMAIMMMSLLLGPYFLSAQITIHPAEQNTQELDQAFIANAQASNLFEIDAAKIALERSTSSEVQNYAQRIIEERSQRAEQYNELVAQKTWQLPQVDVQLYNEQLQQLEAFDANEFDNEYLQASLRNHSEGLSQTQNYAANEHADSEVKNLLSNHVTSYEHNIQWINSYEAASEAQPVAEDAV